VSSSSGAAGAVLTFLLNVDGGLQETLREDYRAQVPPAPLEVGDVSYSHGGLPGTTNGVKAPETVPEKYAGIPDFIAEKKKDSKGQVFSCYSRFSPGTGCPHRSEG